MGQQHYEIVFRGKLLAGQERAQVVARLAKLFGVDPVRVESLLQAPKTVLRRGLDREAASRYRETLLANGIMVAMVGSEGTAGPASGQWRIAALDAPAQVTPAADPAAAPPELSLSDLGTPIGEKRSFNAPKVNLRGVRIAAANVPIDTKPAAAPAQIAAPDLSIDNAAIEDKERSDFTRMLMKELRT